MVVRVGHLYWFSVCCLLLESPGPTWVPRSHGGDVVTRHNLLRDVVANLFRQAHMGVTVEAGYGLTHDNSRSCLADVLVTGWEKGLPAAF